MATHEGPPRPREVEALEIWESLPEDERSYAKVGEIMDVTEGRAGVYVRDAIELTPGKDHLLPKRGRRGSAASTVDDDPNPIHDLERMLGTVDNRRKALTDELAEADKVASEFDPDAAIAAEVERLTKVRDEAQASLDAFADDDNAQTAWATRRQGSLNDRKREVETRVEKLTTTLTKKYDGLAQLIELAKSNPELAEMFASTVDEAEGDDADTLTNEPEGESASDEAPAEQPSA